MEMSNKKSFPVTGMSCASCALSIESMLKSQQDVLDASVNYAASTVLVEYYPSEGILDNFKKAIHSIGYDIIIDEQQNGEQEEYVRNESAILKRKTILASLLTLPIVIIAMFMMKLPYANWIMLVLST